MALTTEGLAEERVRHYGSGVQRLYRWGNRGLSVVNHPTMLLHYPFAWQVAVLRWVDDDYRIDYSTGLTSDVEVFYNDKEANAFIDRARTLFTPKEWRR